MRSDNVAPADTAFNTAATSPPPASPAVTISRISLRPPPADTAFNATQDTGFR
ncbi:MAG: hypothetical protein LBT53_04465 [Puniceicoccales bacterium]|nr:hypothetical protein [Puniceicoccales bacterium]